MNTSVLVVNKAKLFKLIKDVTNPGLIKVDEFKKIYSGVFAREITLEYYIWTVWDTMLKDIAIFGTAINKHEWYNYFKKESTNTTLLDNLFNKLNQKSKSIQYKEFLNFVLYLDKDQLNQFYSVLEDNTISNPLVELDLDDSVVINIDTSKNTPNPKTKPTHLNTTTLIHAAKINNPEINGLVKHDQDTNGSVNHDQETNGSVNQDQETNSSVNHDQDTNSSTTHKLPSCLSFMYNRAYLCFVHLKITFIHIKNKIIDKLYGIV